MWALGAYNSGMYKGDYVWVYLNQQTADPVLFSKITSKDFYLEGDDDDEKVLRALTNFFLVSSGHLVTV